MLVIPLGSAWKIKCGAMALDVLTLTDRVPECALVPSTTAEEPASGVRLKSTRPYPKMVRQPAGTSPAAPLSKSSLITRLPPPELLLDELELLEELEELLDDELELLDELLLEEELELLVEELDEELEVLLEELELLDELVPPQAVSKISAESVKAPPSPVLIL